MAVLTHNQFQDLENKAKKLLGEESNSSLINVSGKKVKVKKCYYFPPAPMGKSQTSIEINIDGNKEIIQIQMVDGIYEINKHFSNKKKEAINNFIVNSGVFFDLSYVVPEEIEEKKEEIKEGKKKKNKTEWILLHPDGEAENVNFHYDYEFDGKKYKVECINSKVKITDTKLCEHLQCVGWEIVGLKES